MLRHPYFMVSGFVSLSQAFLLVDSASTGAVSQGRERVETHCFCELLH